MQKKILAHAVITAMLSINLSALAASTSVPVMEKCYGVAKSSKNDCAIPNANACAAQVKQDKNPKAWIFVPKGTCNKIAGGSTNI